MNKNILPLFLIIMIVSINSAFSHKKVLTYLHPIPGSKYHNLSTKIIVKPDFSFDKKSMQNKDLISVHASKSGTHTGETIISTDGKTIIFIPDNPFYLSDTVFVKISRKLTNNSRDFSYYFTTKSKDASNFENYNTETEFKSGFPNKHFAKYNEQSGWYITFNISGDNNFEFNESIPGILVYKQLEIWQL